MVIDTQIIANEGYGNYQYCSVSPLWVIWRGDSTVQVPWKISKLHSLLPAI